MDKMPALLLVGPTGSGKSPLGALLEKRMGWTHFDFGHQLRLVARGEEIPGLTKSERDYVRGLLSSHSLFPNHRFPIVQKILKYFLERNIHAPGIILNGLPRHVSQAIDVSDFLEIKRVAVLDCSHENSARRVALRVKGLANDHPGRSDDFLEAINRKFVLYTRETAPLIDHYQSTGAQVIRIPVDVGTNEAQIATQIIESIG